MKTQPCVCVTVNLWDKWRFQNQWEMFHFLLVKKSRLLFSHRNEEAFILTSSATSRGDPAEVKVTVRISAREAHEDGLIGHGWVHYVMVTSWLLQNRKHTSAHQTPAAAAFISLPTKPHKKEGSLNVFVFICSYVSLAGNVLTGIIHESRWTKTSVYCSALHESESKSLGRAHVGIPLKPCDHL